MTITIKKRHAVIAAALLLAITGIGFSFRYVVGGYYYAVNLETANRALLRPILRAVFIEPNSEPALSGASFPKLTETPCPPGASLSELRSLPESCQVLTPAYGKLAEHCNWFGYTICYVLELHPNLRESADVILQIIAAVENPCAFLLSEEIIERLKAENDAQSRSTQRLSLTVELNSQQKSKPGLGCLGGDPKPRKAVIILGDDLFIQVDSVRG